MPSVPVPNADPMSTFNLPKVPDAPVPGVTGGTTNTASATPPSNNAAPPVDPEKALAESAPLGSGAITPPQGMPALPLPGLPAAAIVPDPTIVPPSIPDAIPEAAITLPEMKATRTKKPKTVTWQTKLAPSIIPPQTNFNYKRVLLPDSIYATQYDRDNSHLPKRVTREDYQALLFAEVAKNNIDGTRALLNAGTGLEVTNSYGETPLQVARRAGAQDVAALLVARGAH